MQQQRTLQQKFPARKIRRPPALICTILGYLWRLMYMKRLNVQLCRGL